METGIRSTLLARLFLAAASCALVAQGATHFTQVNLVADAAGVAANTDPNLVGTWGMSSSTSSPFWVSNTSNGTSTLYNTAGVANARVVTIPPSASKPGALGTPTGQVWNGFGGFAVAGAASSFIFATLDGTISAWNGAAGAASIITVDNGAAGAVYTGLAIGTSNSAGPVVYAANFGQGKIDVFDTNFKPVVMPGGFRDPDLSPMFSPTNIQRFGRRLYVTYNMPNYGGFTYGSGSGAINVFDTDGNLLQRLVPSNPWLNIPWGVAVAGPNFGAFSYSLLVANFGDGSISAFDLDNGNYIGTMQDSTGAPIAIDGLWGIIMGNGGTGGDPTTLYFAAAPSGGAHGLLGSLKPASDSLLP
jgi:uncharacterized protein (TIGR03118 family)